MSYSAAGFLSNKTIRVRSFVFLAALLIVLPPKWISAWAWENDLRWGYIALIAFFLASLLVPAALQLSARFGVLDLPDARKTHGVPMPKLGGLAVYGGVILTLLRNDQWSRELYGFMASATIIYALGLCEDARGLSARARLAGQLLAAGIAVWSGIAFDLLPGVAGDRWIGAVISLVWLIGITNALNFLDGIDGLAAGMGAVCSLLLLFVAWPIRRAGGGHLAYAAAALAGACLGFLPYNWHKAKIFLGDAGATFIGFSLASLAIMGGGPSENPLVRFATPVIILGIPIFDMIYTTISRVRNGSVHNVKEWIEFVGRDHFHHRLMKLGMDVKQTVWFILLVNLCLGLGALVIRYTTSSLGSILLLGQMVLIFTIVVVLMLLGREQTGAGPAEAPPRA